MRADKFHVDGLVTVGDSYNQAIVVAFDVEDHPAALEDAGASELLLDLGRPSPRCLFSLIYPSLQMLLGAWVFLPELSQVTEGNDSHAASIVPRWDTRKW